ncbi:hypothetical protein BGZ76_006798 [Entomortierella beljakovae]|nr:hypothetical protein BGZ76_006798 [Entomortierella beljakovae]
MDSWGDYPKCSEPMFRLSPPLSSLIAHSDIIEDLTIFFKEGISFVQNHRVDSDVIPGQIQAETFIDILQKCPLRRLKSFKIQGLNQESPFRPYSRACGTSYMNGQLSLQIMGIRDQLLAKILKTVASFKTEEAESVGVKSLAVSDSGSFSIHSLQMIADTSLSTTLTSLDIACCGNFRSEEIHFIMGKMPNLEFADFRCRDSRIGRYSIGAYSGLLTKRPAEKDKGGIDGILEFEPSVWVCGDTLRTLRISVSDAIFNTEIEEPSNMDIIDDFSEWIFGARTYWFRNHALAKVHYPESLFWFYDQIASLTQLKELYIGRAVPGCDSKPFNLSLDAGLVRWSTLTSLEHVDVDEFDSIVGLKDVQWMTENWPALKSIRGLVHENDEIVSEAVIWLKKSRPDIDLPVTASKKESSNRYYN